MTNDEIQVTNERQKDWFVIGHSCFVIVSRGRLRRCDKVNVFQSIDALELPGDFHRMSNND
jgi:hypothetical protein